VTFAVSGYGAVVICLWLVVDSLTDRTWPATLIAFGPRWAAAVPLVPLAFIVVLAVPRRTVQRLIGVLAMTALVLVFGFMDFRLGLGRRSGTPVLRIMTQNVGAGHVTAAALDQFLTAERVDVAALQECPFYDYAMARPGWHFYYGGDLCLVSRFPFAVLDVPDPDNAWRRVGHEPMRFEIEAPTARFQLLNVHTATIRGGLEALGALGGRGLPQFVSNRDESMRESRAARQRVMRATEPLVVAGDFNLPVESAVYRANWGDLRNVFSSCGRGFGHTKFTGFFGIRIDHVLTSEQWTCMDARVLSSPYGGDHAPLVVDLQLR
jgi:vancomycin resistance protein VanJ